MHHGEVPLVAGGVQRRGRFGDMLADDGHVADLAITLAEIKVREANGAGVVRDLRLLQGAVVKGNGARLFAAGEGDAAMQPPQIGVQDLRQAFTNRVRRAAEDGSGLCKIALQEVRFSQHDPHAQFIVPRQV